MRPVERVPYAVTWAGPALLFEQPSAAQTAPGDERPEIVVTAQRRPERPEDVPISLTAMSGEQLERMQATDMAGLGKVVPSLVMTRTGAFTQPYPARRRQAIHPGRREQRRDLCRRRLPRLVDQRPARPARHRAGRGPERAAGNPVRAQCDGRRHPDRHARPDPGDFGRGGAARGHLRLCPGRRLSDRRERPDRRQPRREPVAQRRLRDEPLHRQDRSGRGRPQLRRAEQVDLAAGDRR